MWNERVILVDNYNKDTFSVVELVEVVTHRYYVTRRPFNKATPDYQKEVLNEVEGNKLFSQLMSEKLELF